MDTRSRKYQLTINNPSENGFSQDAIFEQLKAFGDNMIYWCLSDEIGDNETYHTHVYFCLTNAVKFSTVKKRFPVAHIESCKGTSGQNKDYVFKEGKWASEAKGDTNLRDTHCEFGECPNEQPGRRTDIEQLKELVEDGFGDLDIINENPRLMSKLSMANNYRQLIREDRFRKEFRHLDVTYICGSTGTGKTRYVMDKFGYDGVYRVTDYDHPFDNYNGQDVVMFEEFRSSLKIQDVLNYLDGYPLELPSRYRNKVACFTKVFLVTNIGLYQQYESIQDKHKETWFAFLRRINRVYEFFGNGQFKEFAVSDYSKDIISGVEVCDTDNPFKAIV